MEDYYSHEDDGFIAFVGCVIVLIYALIVPIGLLIKVIFF